MLYLFYIIYYYYVAYLFVFNMYSVTIITCYNKNKFNLGNNYSYGLKVAKTN